MHKAHLHFWKCSSLLLTAIVLLSAAGWLSFGVAHALFYSDAAAEPETAPSPSEEIIKTPEPQITSLYEETTEVIPYTTLRTPSPDLPLGEERIIQAGSEGILIYDYEVIYQNGVELSRLLLAETEKAAIQEIIAVGTAVSSVEQDDRIAEVQKNNDGSGILTFASGGTMKFSAIKDVTATAYTAGRGGAGYITASGTPARPGAVAVDRRVIPLGSKLYIVTNDGKYVYGIAVAEDTGVIGNRVDLYYDDYDECIIFGRRAATIYILED